MNLPVFLPFILLLISSFVIISQARSFSCHPHDQKNLLRIKNHLGNPSSLASWSPDTNCCEKWAGVKCFANGHIEELKIADDPQVRGSIPPFFGNLPWLTSLFFIDLPNLSGTIPSSIGKLTKLNQLWITKTSVSGTIPDFLGQLKDLEGLSLCNKHTGPIPKFIGELKSLTLLHLFSNGLSGPIPDFLSQLKDMVLLDLSDNKFTGPIYVGLAQLSNLNYLNLSSNTLSGSIPEYLGHFSNLGRLSLSHNNLNGPIPTSLGRAEIAFLELNHNELTGDAAFLFSEENHGPGEIHINNNFLKFDFTNVGRPEVLWSFDISHNMIYGSLPKWLVEFKPTAVPNQFSFLQNMFKFDVSYNQLCGPIPDDKYFKQADPNIFAHNKCLCGGPLPACK